MLPPIPYLEDYGISPEYGFLPSELPIQRLPDTYYNKWEAIVANLQGLLTAKRLRQVIDRLPILSTAGLEHDSEWRRAYMLLAFMANAYIWGGDKPCDRLPPSITIPFLAVADYLQVKPVATYAAVCLWNFKPLFTDEHVDNLENLSTLTTFTGSMDESWFYLTSVAIEARGAPILPLMIRAMTAARDNDSATVTLCLRSFAERLDDLNELLKRMHEGCDPHVFYHHIRPFLAGSKNMSEAGLPNGVLYDDGTSNATYRQYSGGSNAQSSLIQFFDLILGVEHSPTGMKKTVPVTAPGQVRPAEHNFLHDMREYMPGPHRRFLEDITLCANIKQYVQSHQRNRELTIAYDACLAMLVAFRDTHINIVSRYIILPSAKARSNSISSAPSMKQNIATSSSEKSEGGKKDLKGTGGTALIPFLKQARDETGEPSIDAWTKRAMVRRVGSSGKGDFFLGKVNGENADGTNVTVSGLAGIWTMADFEEGGGGGLCHY